MLNAGENLVSIQFAANGADATIHLDRTKIDTVGKQCIGAFLSKLQILKATADSDGGRTLYDEVTNVPENWTSLRNLVMLKKQPRKVFVQANTFVANGKVTLKVYPSTYEGVIVSFTERFEDVRSQAE
jgi:dipeptidyl-peptidase-3